MPVVAFLLTVRRYQVVLQERRREEMARVVARTKVAGDNEEVTLAACLAPRLRTLRQQPTASLRPIYRSTEAVSIQHD